jgi:hypothetical protein
MLLWGLGAYYRLHWFGLVLPQGLGAVPATLSLSTSIQYANSSYRFLSGEFITIIILIRNRMSFAINYGVTPLINDIGQRNTLIMVAVLALVCNGTMFVAIWWGKKLRQRSAERYWEYVEVARGKGLNR